MVSVSRKGPISKNSSIYCESMSERNIEASTPYFAMKPTDCSRLQNRPLC